MPVPSQATDYVTRLSGLLTSRYVNAPVVSGLAKAFSAPAQTLENSIWGVLNIIGNVFVNGPPGGGPWDFVDKLGALAGITRDGRNDADFWAAILIQIVINNADGRPNDFIRIARLVAGPTPVVGYYEWYPGAFEIDLFDTVHSNISSSVILALATYLGRARPAGVAGFLRYSQNITTLITWGDSTGSNVGAEGFGDSVSGGTNQLAGLAAF